MSGVVSVNAREYQQLRALTTLFDKIWNDPQDGETVRRASKRVNPEVIIPDEHPVVAQLSAKLQQQSADFQSFKDALATEAKERAEKAQVDDLRKALGETQEKFRLTDEGLQKVIGIMQSRQITDPEAAALVYRESLPKTQLNGGTNRAFDTKMNLYGSAVIDEKWRKLHEDPDGFFNDTVAEVFSEMPAGI